MKKVYILAMYSSILIPKQINLRYLFFYNCLQLSVTISIQAKPVFGIKIRSTIEHTEGRLKSLSYSQDPEHSLVNNLVVWGFINQLDVFIWV